MRISSELVYVAAIWTTTGALAGCGGFLMHSGNVTPNDSPRLPSMSGVVVPASPIPLGASAALEWNAQHAEAVEVEGEDIYSTDPAGSHTLAPLHRSIYFLVAGNQAGAVEKNVIIDVIVPEAQQMSAHAQWWADLPAALTTLQCGNEVTYQQPGQSLQNALATASHDPAVSCLVLQPASTTSEVVYYEGLAADSGTTQLRYISDLPDVIFPEPH